MSDGIPSLTDVPRLSAKRPRTMSCVEPVVANAVGGRSGYVQVEVGRNPFRLAEPPRSAGPRSGVRMQDAPAPGSARSTPAFHEHLAPELLVDEVSRTAQFVRGPASAGPLTSPRLTWPSCCSSSGPPGAHRAWAGRAAVAGADAAAEACTFSSRWNTRSWCVDKSWRVGNRERVGAAQAEEDYPRGHGTPPHRCGAVPRSCARPRRR